MCIFSLEVIFELSEKHQCEMLPEIENEDNHFQLYVTFIFFLPHSGAKFKVGPITVKFGNHWLNKTIMKLHDYIKFFLIYQTLREQRLKLTDQCHVSRLTLSFYSLDQW